MGNPLRGRGGRKTWTYPAQKKLKPLTAFALYGALLVIGYALTILDPMASGNPGILYPVRWDIPGNVRNALTGLAALGMMAQGAAMARLIGGGQNEYPCDGFRIDIGFFRPLSDRPPIGQASGRRGGEA